MPKLRLTDGDRVILSSAGARETGLVLPVPKSLKLSSAKLEPVLSSLLRKGLLVERPARPDEKPWNSREDGGRTSLVIAAAGLEALGLGVMKNENATAAAKGDASRPKGKTPSHRPQTPVDAPKPKATHSNPSVAPDETKGTSKLSILIAALRQRKGATIPELMASVSWQAHSVRGAISGALKTKKRLNVVSATEDGRGRVYRISE